MPKTLADHIMNHHMVGAAEGGRRHVVRGGRRPPLIMWSASILGFGPYCILGFGPYYILGFGPYCILGFGLYCILGFGPYCITGFGPIALKSASFKGFLVQVGSLDL